MLDVDPQPETPGAMRAAVEAALAGRVGSVDPRDAGVEQLAQHYAQLVDDAEPAAKYTKPLRLIATACAGAQDPEAGLAFDTIRAALAAHSVASDLGPKLLAALDALGLTPKARAAGGKGDSGDKPTRLANPLDRLRAEHATRRAG
jgi:hypothetical protein